MIYEIGHSRRGQFYYVLCSYEGEFSLFASRPDGAGGVVKFPDIIIQLVLDEVISL